MLVIPKVSSENRKYIPISKITLNDFSSEEVSQNDYAKHIIDGNFLQDGIQNGKVEIMIDILQ